MLAAEYVLGSLRGRARQRFEKLLLSEPGLHDAVTYWQLRLNPLAETLKPVQPPARVWRGIQRRIQDHNSVQPGWFAKLRNSLVFWQGFSLASVVFILLSTLILPGKIPSIEDSPRYVAVLTDGQARPSLVASMSDNGRALKIDMLGPDTTGPDRIMQVWCVPKGGGKPMPIGMLSSEQGRFELSLDQLDALHDAQEIAITFEPVNEAPKEQPSGEIMYRGKII